LSGTPDGGALARRARTEPAASRAVPAGARGPNGAGKTTFFESFVASAQLTFVNADAIARALTPARRGAVAYAAAAAAERRRRRLIARLASFCMETVFSDAEGAKLALLRDAQAAGYTVDLVFIGLENAALSSARVMQRVEDGGHDVPDTKIHARFPRTFVNLRKAVAFVDRAYLFDNSLVDEPYRWIATFHAGAVVARAASLSRWAAAVVRGRERRQRGDPEA